MMKCLHEKMTFSILTWKVEQEEDEQEEQEEETKEEEDSVLWVLHFIIKTQQGTLNWKVTTFKIKVYCWAETKRQLVVRSEEEEEEEEASSDLWVFQRFCLWCVHGLIQDYVNELICETRAPIQC